LAVRGHAPDCCHSDHHDKRTSLEKDALAALERHDTTSARFHARADAINASATEKMLDVRFLMREQLSEVQWRSLFPPPAAPHAGEWCDKRTQVGEIATSTSA